MHFKIYKSFIIYAILLFYVCTPMLDSMLCADCVGNVSFRDVTTVSHMETSHVDVSYSEKGCSQSNTSNEQGNKSLCSICANSALSTEVYSQQMSVLGEQNYLNPLEQPISELHYSIHKPPPNFFV